MSSKIQQIFGRQPIDYVELYKCIHTVSELKDRQNCWSYLRGQLQELNPKADNLFDIEKIEDCRKEILKHIDSAKLKYIKNLTSFFYNIHQNPDELNESEHKILCDATDQLLQSVYKLQNTKELTQYQKDVKEIEGNINEQLNKNPHQFNFFKPINRKDSISYVAMKLCLEDIMMKIIEYSEEQFSWALYSNKYLAKDYLAGLYTDDNRVKTLKDFKQRNNFTSDSNDKYNNPIIQQLWKLAKIYQLCQTKS